MMLDDLLQLVSVQLGQPSVLLEDRLYEDLGAESMDLVHIAIAIEDRFGIFIQEEELADFCTVGDLYELVERSLEGTP